MPLSDPKEFYRSRQQKRARVRPCKNCGPVEYTPEEIAAAKARKTELAGCPEQDARQKLFTAYVCNRAARTDPCWHRGPKVDAIAIKTCGGAREATFEVSLCSLTGKRVADPDCWLCDKYLPHGGKP